MSLVSYQDGSDVTQTLSADNYRTVEVVNGMLVEWTASFESPALFDYRADGRRVVRRHRRLWRNCRRGAARSARRNHDARLDLVPKPRGRQLSMAGRNCRLPSSQLIAGFRRNTPFNLPKGNSHGRSHDYCCQRRCRFECISVASGHRRRGHCGRQGCLSLLDDPASGCWPTAIRRLSRRAGRLALR
jgi:hypothetical protein